MDIQLTSRGSMRVIGGFGKLVIFETPTPAQLWFFFPRNSMGGGRGGANGALGGSTAGIGAAESEMSAGGCESLDLLISERRTPTAVFPVM